MIWAGGTLQNCRFGVMLMAVGRMVFIHSETVSLFLVELTWAKSWKIIWGSPVPFFPLLASLHHPYQEVRHIANLQIKQKSISIRQHQSGNGSSTGRQEAGERQRKISRSKERKLYTWLWLKPSWMFWLFVMVFLEYFDFVNLRHL